MTRGPENTQLYQIISVEQYKLNNKAITATGHIYDEFDLIQWVAEWHQAYKAQQRFLGLQFAELGSIDQIM